MLIAGGGTGGHLFPGVALAEELTLRNLGHEVVFVGTARGIEVREVPRAGFVLELIKVRGLKGMGLWGWVRGLLKIPGAIWQSLGILRRHRPDMVVGVGGYASGPMLLAAWLKRLPTAVLEQNALPGLTNRVLGRFVRKVFVAFEQSAAFFKPAKVQLLGNPVRRSLVDNFLVSNEPRAGEHLLVFGGSQGARVLNRVVPDAVALLKERFPSLDVVHQTGEAQAEQVRARYKELGIQAQVQPFIQDMATVYRQADVVVSRAGATTVAELSLCRKPAVLIPFPQAADNHQEINAGALVDAGAAVMIREHALTAGRLAEELGDILGSADRRMAMEEAAGKVSRPESAREICEACLEMVRRPGSHGKDGA